MKYLKFDRFVVVRERKKYLDLFKSISILSDSKLSIMEMEIFLNIEISNFDKEFFNKYFQEYTSIIDNMNPLNSIVYISFNEELKTNIINSLLKKIIYPLFLIISSFVTLIIFKQSLLSLLKDYTTNKLNILVNLFYYFSLILIIIIIIILVFTSFLFKRKDLLILSFNRFRNISILEIIEIYYLKSFIYLLLLTHNEGYSTLETFVFINKLKSNQIVSNIAYFLNSDLEDGLGIEKSISNMRINDKFKNVLNYALKSSDFRQFVLAYDSFLDNDIKFQIDKLTKILFIFAYIYIAALLLLFYQIILLPLTMINTLWKENNYEKGIYHVRDDCCYFNSCTSDVNYDTKYTESY